MGPGGSLDTTCANASASRLPFTGSTCVAGSGSGIAWRAASQDAIASRSAAGPIVMG
jgi:hypothetical protein